MIVLVDYNLTGYIVLLQETLAAEGWLDLLSIRFVTLGEVGLAFDSSECFADQGSALSGDSHNRIRCFVRCFD